MFRTLHHRVVHRAAADVLPPDLPLLRRGAPGAPGSPAGLGVVPRRAPLDALHQQPELPFDESPPRVVVESPGVRGGVGALPDVPDDLRERISLHHQLIVFLYGARSQRAANLGDGDGDGDLDENGVLTRGDGERKSSSGAHLIDLRRVELLRYDGPQELLHLTQLVRGHGAHPERVPGQRVHAGAGSTLAHLSKYFEPKADWSPVGFLRTTSSGVEVGGTAGGITR